MQELWSNGSLGKSKSKSLPSQITISWKLQILVQFSQATAWRNCTRSSTCSVTWHSGQRVARYWKETPKGAEAVLVGPRRVVHRWRCLSERKWTSTRANCNATVRPDSFACRTPGARQMSPQSESECVLERHGSRHRSVCCQLLCMPTTCTFSAERAFAAKGRTAVSMAHTERRRLRAGRRRELTGMDHYSTFPFVRAMGRWCKGAITYFRELFGIRGIPELLFTDNGPQFDSYAFKQFAKQWSFGHTTSSPRYAQSHGFAERTVQTVKNTIHKTKMDELDSELALLCLRTTPISDKIRSPVEMLMGRKAKASLPTSMRNQLADSEQMNSALRDRQVSQKSNYDSRVAATIRWSARPLPVPS